MEFKECTKSIKGRVITLNKDDLLVSVIPVRKNGLVGMIDNDKLYYVKLETIPVLKRASAGNRLVKNVPDRELSTAVFMDRS